jgi:hypothetical protein
MKASFSITLDSSISQSLSFYSNYCISTSYYLIISYFEVGDLNWNWCLISLLKISLWICFSDFELRNKSMLCNNLWNSFSMWAFSTIYSSYVVDYFLSLSWYYLLKSILLLFKPFVFYSQKWMFELNS